MSAHVWVRVPESSIPDEGSADCHASDHLSRADRLDPELVIAGRRALDVGSHAKAWGALVELVHALEAGRIVR